VASSRIIVETVWLSVMTVGRGVGFGLRGMNGCLAQSEGGNRVVQDTQFAVSSLGLYIDRLATFLEISRLVDKSEQIPSPATLNVDACQRPEEERCFWIRPIPNNCSSFYRRLPLQARGRSRWSLVNGRSCRCIPSATSKSETTFMTLYYLPCEFPCLG
jgi:hypothetical protein